jgi:hypothetical protein
MNTKVEFPQPMHEYPTPGCTYFFVTQTNEISFYSWVEDITDRNLFSARNAYATEAEAVQRALWNIQELNRVCIPTWAHALGPALRKVKAFCEITHIDWEKAEPKHYRSKPKHITRKINDSVFNWPPTAEKGDPEGFRYVLTAAGDITYHSNSELYGSVVHLTYEGAKAQQAAWKAFCI